MAGISRLALYGKLNPVAYKALDSAHAFCKLRGNPYVELVHWLFQILQLPDSDLHRAIKVYALNPTSLAKQMTEALERLPRGATSVSDLSDHIEEATERAWVYASLMYKESQIRTGHLLLGIVKTPGLRRVLNSISAEFERIKSDDLADQFERLFAESPEAALPSMDGTRLGETSATGISPQAAEQTRQEALERFSIDLTDRARKGQIDPVIGREDEIRQLIDILMRRRQNNPILTGEAGVGKTAVVEGFALKIAQGQVPPALKDVILRTLDVGLLQAGASMKGEFENRLRQVIDEVQASAKPVILFIDEAHTLIGAGGAMGTGDAANLLKPALARGTLRTIAATTWAEYKKYIEKDAALVRRFQVVQVHEPVEQKALDMLRGVVAPLEQHHGVHAMDDALVSAVKLSRRYIPARQLPDKAVSLLDTAMARVAISQHGMPAEIEDCERRIEATKTELEILAREQAVGIDTSKHAGDVSQRLLDHEAEHRGLTERWSKEKQLVSEIHALQTQLRRSDTGSEQISAREEQLIKLRLLQNELRALQGEAPLVHPLVDGTVVASVISDWTGIPVGRMVKNEIEAVLRLSETLNRRVIGQRHALDRIANQVQISRAELDNPSKPIGVFLLCGPSGVGKTETALALAESLYGGEQNVITINMSEFQEAHTVSTLKGAPPGYVGYGEGGVLTEAVRRRPYSVVLLDEVEKAHHDVHEIFFQVFDKGWMEDGEGRRVDFKNTLILLTSNVGSELIMNLCKDPALMPDADGLAKALRDPLLKVFPAALLGRLVVIPYYPLSEDMLSNIIRLQLSRVERRLAESHKVPLTYEPEVVKLIGTRCTELESGARMVEAIISRNLLPRISQRFLHSLLGGETVQRVHLSVAEGDFAVSFD
jgi:type VI secretion system protein VasG